MQKDKKNIRKSLDRPAQEIVLVLREVVDKDSTDNIDHLKSLIMDLEWFFDSNPTISQSFDSNKAIAQLLNIPEKKVKALSNRERVKLDAILKRLFETSPRMFLGTIDDLYETNYRDQYLSGSLTDADIVFLPTEFIRDTFRFEVLKADIIIQIKDNYYQIEIQTSHDNMAIRFARYGLEIGLKKQIINPETGALKIELPEQSVIYLENNKNNPDSNDYEFWWKNKKLATIQVKDLKLWELDIDNMLERKLYNLLPVLIFNYRIKLDEVQSDEDKQKLKDEFLEEAKQILKKANTISDQLIYCDIDAIVTSIGELINYFDFVFFDGEIERLGEFKMTFTEEIKGYRAQINTAKEEGLAEGIEKGLAEGLEKGIKKGKKEGIAEGLEKGIKKGKKEGIAEGLEKGIKKGKKEGLAEGLEKGKKEGLEEGLEKGKKEGLEEGLAEGLEQGLEKGIIKEKNETAKNLLKKGSEINFIIDITGLSEEEVKKLQAEIKKS